MSGVIVVMGVSGCGKSTLGRALAEELGFGFLEGDDFHPPANVARMAAGMPLTDAMRWDWLRDLGRAAGRQRDAGVVVSCSALKRSYRDLLREAAGPVRFVFPDLPREVVAARLLDRKGHYMPPGLLGSQFDTLERPGRDETDVTTIPLAAPPGEVLRATLAALERGGA